MPHNWNQCPQKGPLFSLSQDNQHANDNFVARYHQSAAVGPQSSSHDDALLLASFADIASKIVSKPIQESHSLHALPSNDAARPLLSCQFPSLPSNVSSSSNATFKGNPRPRTISYSANEVSRSKLQRLSGLAQTSLGLMQTSEQLQCSLATKSHVITQQEIPQPPCRVILRKKFSWKHYPPLEEFLIANREEYLRHSTLNYTLQQKKYNNMLTQQMIQLASQHRLVFDKNDFSFVTVRDRIRCYYKSYVQSLKKRGVICGYAARKAGLISKEEMNKSAATKSKIFVPH